MSVRAVLLFLAVATVLPAAGPRGLGAAQLKHDPTLRDLFRLSSSSDPFGVPLPDGPVDFPLGGPVDFSDPPRIDFPVPGSGEECRVDPGADDAVPRGPDDAPPDRPEDLLGDDVGFRDPLPIDFPVPGSGDTCPVNRTPGDAVARGPEDDAAAGDETPSDDDAPPEEDVGDLLGGPIGFENPPPIDFPIPGSGDTCPFGAGPEDYLRPRIFRTGVRFDYNPDPVDTAPPDPGVQVVIATFPTLRYHLRPEVVTDPLAPGGGADPHASDEPLRVYVTSRGRLGADGVQVTILATGEESVELSQGAVVLEPVVLSREAMERLRAERRSAEERPEASGSADAYCLDIEREPPVEGVFLRIAEDGVQRRYDAHRRVLDAAARLRDAGRLVPDSDPESYFHSIRQWSIWTLTESLDETGFAEAFVAQARKNFEAADQEWSESIERAVRQIVPGRWAAVMDVLEAARQEESEE